MVYYMSIELRMDRPHLIPSEAQRFVPYDDCNGIILSHLMFLSPSAKGLLQHQRLENSLHAQDKKPVLIFLYILTCFVMPVDLNLPMTVKIPVHCNIT